MLKRFARARCSSFLIFSPGLLSIRAQEAQQTGIPWWVWLILILVILAVVAWWWLNRRPAESTYQGAAAYDARSEAAPAPAAPDDLVVIEGIGPKIAAMLQAAGINTFAQLAEADPGRLEQILRDNNLRLADPSSWPEQARLAAAGDWEGLQRLQDALKGGREA